jgi:hypothetical protein
MHAWQRCLASLSSTKVLLYDIPSHACLEAYQCVERRVPEHSSCHSPFVEQGRLPMFPVPTPKKGTYFEQFLQHVTVGRLDTYLQE